MSHPDGNLRTHHRALATAILSAMLLVAAALPVGAAGPPGNNGTVKIHSSDPGEPSPEIKNEPHVGCPFHVHFYFADTDQSGPWKITGQAPSKGLDGTYGWYDTLDGTSYRTDDIFLSAGHYKLSWQGRNDNNLKHKTFWVDGECGEGGGEGGGGANG
jgi:hypothetical protein